MTYFPDPTNLRVDALIGQARPPIDAVIRNADDLAALRLRWSELEAVPVFIEDRGAGVDHSWGSLDVRTLVRGEQSAGRFSAHSLKLSPGAELPAHYFDDAHVYILVAEGVVELRVGQVADTVERFGLGYIPPRTRYGVRNRSSAPATVIAVYSPAGVERAFAEAHHVWTETGEVDAANYRSILERYGFRFDDTPLANDTLTNKPLPPLDFDFKGGGDLEVVREQLYKRPAMPRLTRTPPANIDDTAPVFRKQLLVGDDSAGQGMLHLLAGGDALRAPPHHQPSEDEFFFIMQGPLHMTCATEFKIIGDGAVAYCPRNCTHGFETPATTRACFVTLNSPAGHERAMARVRQKLADGIGKDELRQLSIDGGFVFHERLP